MFVLDSYSIDKHAAVRFGSEAWAKSVLGKNSTAGFRSVDIFPLSLLQMKQRVELFKNGGMRKAVQTASWL